MHLRTEPSSRPCEKPSQNVSTPIRSDTLAEKPDLADADASSPRPGAWLP